jgi:hypothetical protein
MRIARVGARYLESRERRLWMALVVLVGLTLAGKHRMPSTAVARLAESLGQSDLGR